MTYGIRKSYHLFDGTRWSTIDKEDFDLIQAIAGWTECIEQDEDTFRWYYADGKALELRYWYEELD